MIICGCPRMHPEHEFVARDGAWGLCRVCSHALGAHGHRSTVDGVIEFLRTVPVDRYDVEVREGGRHIRLDLYTEPTP